MRIPIGGGFTVGIVIIAGILGLSTLFGPEDDSKPAVARKEIVKIVDRITPEIWRETQPDMQREVCRRWLLDRVQNRQLDRVDELATEFSQRITDSFEKSPGEFATVFQLLRARNEAWLNDLD